MQQVIMSMNSDSEAQFVSVYVDDILVFSKTLEVGVEGREPDNV